MKLLMSKTRSLTSDTITERKNASGRLVIMKRNYLKGLDQYLKEFSLVYLMIKHEVSADPWVSELGGRTVRHRSTVARFVSGREGGADSFCGCEFLDKIQTKVFKSFPPCYLQSPLQLCLEISNSSNSCNLLQFLHLVTVLCKGEKRKEVILKPQV
jgi:hypothetical protein